MVSTISTKSVKQIYIGYNENEGNREELVTDIYTEDGKVFSCLCYGYFRKEYERIRGLSRQAQLKDYIAFTQTGDFLEWTQNATNMRLSNIEVGEMYDGLTEILDNNILREVRKGKTLAEMARIEKEKARQKTEQTTN